MKSVAASAVTDRQAHKLSTVSYPCCACEPRVANEGIHNSQNGENGGVCVHFGSPLWPLIGHLLPGLEFWYPHTSIGIIMQKDFMFCVFLWSLKRLWMMSVMVALDGVNPSSAWSEVPDVHPSLMRPCRVYASGTLPLNCWMMAVDSLSGSTGWREHHTPRSWCLLYKTHSS